MLPARCPARSQAEGVAVRSLVPGYPAVLDALDGGVTVAVLDNLFGGAARIVAARASGLDLFVIDAPHLYARDGDPYRDPAGREWSDNAFRFAALCRVAALLAQGLVEGYRPECAARARLAGRPRTRLSALCRHAHTGRDDDPQSGLSRPLSGLSAGKPGFAGRGLRRSRRRVLR